MKGTKVFHAERNIPLRRNRAERKFNFHYKKRSRESAANRIELLVNDGHSKFIASQKEIAVAFIYDKTKKGEKILGTENIFGEGEYCLLIKDLKLFDQEYFFRQFRMSPSVFELLLSMVGPRLKKTTTNMRDPISPSERLTVTWEDSLNKTAIDVMIG